MSASTPAAPTAGTPIAVVLKRVFVSSLAAAAALLAAAVNVPSLSEVAAIFALLAVIAAVVSAALFSGVRAEARIDATSSRFRDLVTEKAAAAGFAVLATDLLSVTSQAGSLDVRLEQDGRLTQGLVTIEPNGTVELYRAEGSVLVRIDV